jgi:arsenical pump membrane protein
VVIEVLALAALAAALAAAVARRRRLPEAAVALGGAALLLALGGVSWDQAVDEARHVGPTLALLAGLLVLADGCERAGLFSALADRIAGSSRGSPRRLLALVFGAGTAVTVVLGLDATVVLLTPAILVAARRARLEPRPSLFACTHLANSASLSCRSPISRTCSRSAPRASRSRTSPRSCSCPGSSCSPSSGSASGSRSRSTTAPRRASRRASRYRARRW